MILPTHNRAIDPAMRGLAAHLLPPLLFVVLVWMLVPFGDVFTFDPDEGNNLMKARLVADGHGLYSEIWSDQPPLFTHMLRAWMPLVGWTVAGGRVLVLLCSGVLVWAFYQTVRISAGHFGAIVASLLLVTSFGYTRLSVSVMLAVPSLMFAMLGVYGLVRHRTTGGDGWLAMSGVCLSLSVFVKMWTLVLAVILIGALLRRRRSLLWWGVPFASVSLIMLLAAVPLDEMGQLVRPHLDVRGAADFTPHLRGFVGHFVEDLLVVVPAVIGAGLVLFRRRWIGLIPVAWAALAMVVLLRHEPLWYHHYLLVSIPLCWCAAFVAAEVASMRRGLKPAVAFVAVTCFALHLPAVYERDVAAWTDRDQTADEAIVEAMSVYADQTNFLMTDRQILAFRAGLRVPPPLAVTSLKRRWSGQLGDDELIRMLDTWAPEQIFLSGRRLPVTETLLGYLGPRYRLMHVDPRGGALLLRNDL